MIKVFRGFPVYNQVVLRSSRDFRMVGVPINLEILGMQGLKIRVASPTVTSSVCELASRNLTPLFLNN